MGNQMEKAFVKAGCDPLPKSKKRNRKKIYKCKVCGEKMESPDWGNFMYCTNCNKSFFLFTKKSA